MHSGDASEHYLEVARKNFRDLKALGDKTLEQISEEDCFWKPDPEANSIAILIRHMGGNMVSRWTDFLTTDGEKATRQRDSEFEDQTESKADLVRIWETGWHAVFQAVDSLTSADLMKTVFIRSKAHTVIEAIQRQIVHYASHIGQIVFIAKTLRQANWQSLSIPKKRK